MEFGSLRQSSARVIMKTMGALVRDEQELKMLLASVGLSVVLVVALIVLYVLKRRHQSDQWRWKVPRFTRLVIDRTIGVVVRRVPWKPLLIWGPWVAIVLAFAFYSFENWRGTRAWEKKQEELLARGEPLTWRDLAGEIPAEENFLLHPWVRTHVRKAPMELWGYYLIGRELEPGKVDLVEWYRLSSGGTIALNEKLALHALEKSIAGFNPELDGVAPALQERPGWPLVWMEQEDEFQQELFDGCYRTFLWTVNLMGRSILRALLDDTAGAVHDLETSLRLAPMTIHGSPDPRMLRGACYVIWNLLYTAKVDPDSLNAVEGLLGEIDCAEILHHHLRIQRLLFVTEVDEVLRDRKLLEEPSWRVPIFDLYADWMPDALEDGQQLLNVWLWRLGPLGWFDRWKADAATLYDEISQGEEIWGNALLQARIEELGLPSQCNPFDSWVLPGRAHVREQTSVDLTRIAIHLERFRRAQGRYPNELKELVPTYLPELPKDRGAEKDYRYHLEQNGVPRLSGITLSDIEWKFPSRAPNE